MSFNANKITSKLVDKPWIINALNNSIRMKYCHNIHHLFILKKSQDTKMRYTVYKNQLLSISKLTKNNYYRKVLAFKINSIIETWYSTEYTHK